MSPGVGLIMSKNGLGKSGRVRFIAIPLSSGAKTDRPVDLVPKIGATIATALYARQPLKYNFATNAIGVQLYRAGCRQKVG
jgi:hypothetical protein